MLKRVREEIKGGGEAKVRWKWREEGQQRARLGGKDLVSDETHSDFCTLSLKPQTGKSVCT